MSWIADISREKNATGILFSTEIFLAIERVKAVLPIPGLAAIIIKSLSCHPDVSLSISWKPDGIPLSPSFFDISSIFALARLTKLSAVWEFFLRLPWDIS